MPLTHIKYYPRHAKVENESTYMSVPTNQVQVYFSKSDKIKNIIIVQDENGVVIQDNIGNILDVVVFDERYAK